MMDHHNFKGKEIPHIKLNPDMSIEALLTDTIAKLGENISIARFSRFQLGENAPTSESPDSE